MYYFDDNHPFSVDSGDRYEYRNIVFDAPMADVPSIVLSITGIQGDDKIELAVDDVTTQGFSMVVRVWDTAKVYWLIASWVAHL